jgi:hypothetical protein
LQRAQINKPKNLIRAKFMLSPKIDDNVANKILFLLSVLVFVYLEVILVGIFIQDTEYQDFKYFYSHKLSPSY